MYKNSADLLPTAISSLFVRNDVCYDHYTRISILLHVPVGHTGLTYKTFRFSAIKIWKYVEANVPINISFTSLKMQLNVICLEIMLTIFISLSNFPIDNKCLYITFTVSTFSVI